MRYYRPTWAEINLGNLAHNFKQVKKLLAPQVNPALPSENKLNNIKKSGVKIMVTVKADAYGHGLIPVARKLASCGVDYLGVASIDEGIALRRQNIKLPILVLGIVLKKDIEPLFRYGLIPTVCTGDLAIALHNQAKRLGKIINVHVKVDTGMGRIGVLPQDLEAFIKRIRKLSSINIEGIFTHFASADTDKEFTLYQIALFERLITKLANDGIHIPLIHCANSMGVIGYKKSHFNLVRPGLVIYGLYPAPLLRGGIYPKEGLKIKLKPVLSLKTKVVYSKRVPPGSGISYGHIYVTKRDTTIVTLPIGYGDGYPRNLSNIAPVLIRGKRFKISGRVCMDQIMVDVGNLTVKLGDEVILIGSQDKNRISLEELAELSGTISYEIVCGLGSRVPRVYIK